MINYSPTSLISWHLKFNACHLYPRNDLFLILGWSRISIQDLTTDSAFSYFFMDKIKSSQLGNWELLFPTHPPLVFRHFLGLACYFHILDNSCFFLLVRSLIDLVSALATYGGLLYFGKSAFLSFMSCFHTIRLPHEGCTIYVLYYS